VKFFRRGLILFMLSMSMLVSVGCSTDNETEAEKLAKTAGDPGAANPKGIPAAKPTAPTSQADMFKQQSEAQKELGKQGYPGAKK
jgi:hypothetical protein